MTFAADFREHVLPRVKAQVETSAFMVACGSADYDEAFYGAIAEARRYGAMQLPEHLFRDLRDWIGSALLQGVMAAEAQIEALEAALAEAEASDPVQHYTDLAAACSPGMEWVFAAISPEYRAHLIAGKRGGR